MYAKLLGDHRPVRLLSQSLTVSDAIATALLDKAHGLYFDWGPDSGRYVPHIDRKEPQPTGAELLKVFGVPVPSSADQ